MSVVFSVMWKAGTVGLPSCLGLRWVEGSYGFCRPAVPVNTHFGQSESCTVSVCS